MEINLLVAIRNLIKAPTTNLVARYQGTNRINNVGEALEFYVKDLFCGSSQASSIEEKNTVYNKYFSYIGNQNNPPDIIIRQGDAIEVKKIESPRSEIALNSSYPKDKLYSDSPMITQSCKDCEDWQEKDLIYVVGTTKNDELKTLWFIYGDCYAADKEVYERIKNKISKGVNELEDVEFSKTNELARINRVDPLGITYLRVRGMWGMDNPIKVFDYIAPHQNTNFSMNAIMTKEKYFSFPEEDRQNIEELAGDDFSIQDVKIKSPNNPAKLLEVKLLSFNK